MEKVGKDGVVTVEESKGITTEVEYVEGMAFDRGYISPYFVTNSEKMEAELDDPYILITDKKISAVTDILPLLERLLQVSKNLLIIADDVEGEALATLAVNKLRGTINVIAVKAPGFGDRRKDNLARPRRPHRRDADQRGAGPQARLACRSRTSAAPARHHRQGEHDDHRGPRQEVGRRWPREADQDRARDHDVRLGPREAAGAPRQAGRQRRRHQGRRRDGGRAEGEEAPRRGRALGDARGGRRGHRLRRRRGAHQRAAGARQGRRSKATSRPARTSSSARSRSRCAASRSTPARTAPSSCRR